MAFPPSVPTSFVPRSATTPFRPSSSNLGDFFAIVCYGAFGITLLLAGGVFGYHWYLKGIETTKTEQITQAKATIDTATIESFIVLNDRLIESKGHLNAHAMLSGLFSVLESVEPTTVRFSSLQLTFKERQGATLGAAGVAASFNALAALSQILGKDGRLKDAVFSGLSISKTGVAFALTATVEPSLTAFTAEGLAPAAPPVTASTTPTLP